MGASDGARKRTDRGAASTSIDAENVDALFALDQLPIYSQGYRKARGLAVDERAEDMEPDDAVEEADSRNEPGKTDRDRPWKIKARRSRADAVTPWEAKAERSPATPAPAPADDRNESEQADEAADETKSALIVERHARAPSAPAAQVFNSGRPMPDGVLASVQRRSDHGRSSSTAASRRSNRGWWLTAGAIAVLSGLAVLWPAAVLSPAKLLIDGGDVAGEDPVLPTEPAPAPSPMTMPERSWQSTAAVATVPDQNDSASQSSTEPSGVDTPQSPSSEASPVETVDQAAERPDPSVTTAPAPPPSSGADIVATDKATTKAALAAILSAIERQQSDVRAVTSASETATEDSARTSVQTKPTAVTVPAFKPLDETPEEPAPSPAAAQLSRGAETAGDGEGPSTIGKASASHSGAQRLPGSAHSTPTAGQPAPPPEQDVRTARASPEENAGLETSQDRAASDDGTVDSVQAAAASKQLDSRIVLHLNAEARLEPGDAVMRALIDAGYPRPELRRVDFPISGTNIRYFFAADRPNAQTIDRIVAQTLGEAPPAGPRDFTHYRPLPIANTVEVWIAN